MPAGSDGQDTLKKVV